jgi:cell division transport system ATP-binding protein
MALIRLDHVTKRYRDRIALSDISLSFDPGEWVFVLGPSGAGKSTLLRVLALAEKPTAGQVELDPDSVAAPRERLLRLGLPEAGAEAAAGEGDRAAEPTGAEGEAGGPRSDPDPPPRRRRKVPARLVRRMVGVLGQEFRLLPDRSVYDNISIACQIAGVWNRSEIRERVHPLLDQMGIRGREGLYPNDLSAGERQRAALARAMVRHPRILVADEPTGNLDPGAAAQIFALLRDICDRGTLVVVATHAEDWRKRHPGRAIRLERGILRADERLETLL